MAVGYLLRNKIRADRTSFAIAGSNFAIKPASCFDGEVVRFVCTVVEICFLIIAILLDWQSISDEVCNSTRSRRIQVRQHSNHITWPRTDLQLAIHPRRATAMAEASRPVNRRVLKSISILTAARCLDFPRREHLGVLRLE